MKLKRRLLPAFTIAFAACGGDDVSSVDDGEIDLSPLQSAAAEAFSSNEASSSSSEKLTLSSSSQGYSSSVVVNPLYVGYDYLWVNRVDPLWNECNSTAEGKKAYLKVDNLKLTCRYDGNLKQWLWTVDMNGVYSVSSSSSQEVLPASCSSLPDSSSSSSSEIIAESSSSSGAFGTLVDGRDGQVYRTVTIGEQTWMAQNLNYAYTDSEETSYCYNDNTINCDVYGRLYGWDAANNACPEGWYLPTYLDWTNLLSYVSNNYEYGVTDVLKSDKLWISPEGTYNGLDLLGFAAYPAGAMDMYNTYMYLGTDAFFWSSVQFSDTKAYFFYINKSKTYLTFSYSEKNVALSVRCIKDEE